MDPSKRGKPQEKSLSERFRRSKSARPPTQAGIVPENWLPDKSRTVKEPQPSRRVAPGASSRRGRNCGESPPVRRLPLKSSLSNLVRVRQVVGMGPVSWLSAKTKTASSSSPIPQSEGRAPVKPFPDRSR